MTMHRILTTAMTLAAASVVTMVHADVGADAGPDAYADSGVPVAPRPPSVLETDDAYFFESTSNPSVVFYFPKMMTTVFRSEPVFPGVERWRAAVVLKKLSSRDPGALNTAWAGKILRPYSIKLTSECALTRDPAMRSVQTSITALNRDLSGAESTPVCEFLFRLPSAGVDAKIEALTEQAKVGTLITKAFDLAVRTDRAFAWNPLLTSLQTLVSDPPDAAIAPNAAFTPSEARVLVARAVGQDAALAASLSAVSDADKQAFFDAAMGKLFAQESGGLTVVAHPVDGEFVLSSVEHHAL